MHDVTDAPPAAMPQEFVAAMRLLAAGVVMVTTRVDGRPWGLTITSCCSVSATPPLVLISLSAHTRSRSSILESGVFGLNLLKPDHKVLAERCAQAGTPKFIDGSLGADELPARLRSPAVDGAAAYLDCALDRAIEAADHTLILGRVERAVVLDASAASSEPLLYFDQTFRRIGQAVGE
ncbi:MAG TPA: flavin reductase family protein [Gaiellaceae bacterium]|nr:flavin reductase family protein [Gaiellaceae bacterium]